MIPAIVLAAGRSSRMGRPKAALTLPGGATFLSHVVRSLAAGGVSQIVVVTGRDAQAVRDAAAGTVVFVPVAFIANPLPDRGQLSSVACGLEALPRDVPAALVTLVDVPMPLPSTVRKLIDRWALHEAPLVRPTRDGRHGHPFIAGRAVLEALRAAPSTFTTRDVLQPWLPGDEVPIDDEGPYEDVDTPEEYEQLLARLVGRPWRDPR